MAPEGGPFPLPFTFGETLLGELPLYQQASDLLDPTNSLGATHRGAKKIKQPLAFARAECYGFAGVQGVCKRVGTHRRTANQGRDIRVRSALKFCVSIGAAAAMVGGLVTTVAVGSAATAGASTSSCHFSRPLKIVGMWDVKGEDPAAGNDFQNGLQLALKKING